MYFNEEVDPFNEKGSRNAVNTNWGDYNCLSYAFHTYAWTMPYKDFDDRLIDVEQMLFNGLDFDECAEVLLEIDTEWILENLGKRARIVYDQDEELDEDENLVAFREYVGEDVDEWDKYDSDFHAMIRLDGIWYEKCGGGEPHKVKEDQMWENTMGFYYNSSTAYFAVKDI